MATTMLANMISIEKLGCKIRRIAAIAKGIPGWIKLHFKLFISEPASESLTATITISPNFSTSEGCSWKNPKSTQRLAPRCAFPKMRQYTVRAQPPAKMTRENFFQTE